MKKILLTMVAALTAVTFTNCSKEEAFAPEQVGKPFELVASPETRTVNDGMATLWAEGDAVNVFHAVEGDTETFINDGEFTLADVTTGTFTGTLTGDELTEDSSYDWYMFYPYSSYISTPANTSTGYMPVGSQSNASQAQTGINSMAHIAGSNYPMAGKVEGVMGGEKPHITMKHVSALVRVNVTNKNAEAINVTSVKLTAPEDIVGTYYINFAGETLEFTGSGDSYVSSTATLTVTDGVIEAGETASFYLAIKPIELENEAITVAINAEGLATVEQEFTALTTSFSAGKIKTINVAYESSDEIEWTTIADIHAATAEGTYNIKDATVVLKMAKSCLLKDATGYLYSYQNLDVNEGDVVNIINATTSTYGERQIKSGATIEVVGTTTVEHPVATEIADGAAFSTLATSHTVGDYVTVEATKITIGSYINFYVDGASHTGSLVAPMEDLSQYNNLPVKITGYTGYLNNSYFYLFPTKVEILPYLQAKSGSLAWDAGDWTAKTVAIDTDNDWTITSAPAWVEAVHTDVATLTVTPTKEGPADGRSGIIELAHIANPAITATVTVIQNASDALATYSWTLASGVLGTSNTPAESVLKGTPEMTWNMAYTWKSTAYLGWDGNNGRGVQIGSGNKPVTTFSISTTDFTSKVSKVTVNAATASSGNCTIAVTVGGVALTCSSTKLTTTATDYEFVAATPATGEIIITYTNNASKAVYLGSIKINE